MIYGCEGRCKPSAMELAPIAEAQPVLANLFAKLRIMDGKDFPLVENSMRGKKIFDERKEIR